jgi:hypothetical protein
MTAPSPDPEPSGEVGSGAGSGRGCGVSIGLTLVVLVLLVGVVVVGATIIWWWPPGPDAREVVGDVRSGFVRAGVDCIDWRVNDEPDLFREPGSSATGYCDLGPTVVNGFEVSDGAVLVVDAYSESTDRYLARRGNEPGVCPWVEGEHFIVKAWFDEGDPLDWGMKQPRFREEALVDVEAAMRALSEAMEAELHACP